MDSTRQTRRSHEAGFTVIESTLALTIVFVVLLGLLAGLSSGAKGVVTGRQRSAGLAVANEILELARARAYAEVGHDLDSDPTLSADPLVSRVGTTLMYTGVSPAEPLSGSSLDAGTEAESAGNVLFPFSPHITTSRREGTTFTATTYITQVIPSTGTASKRVSVSVSWRPNQYAGTANRVDLSTLLFPIEAPPDPLLNGQARAEAGSFTVTGVLAGIDLASAGFVFPFATGSVDSGFVRSASGVAGTTRSELLLLSGTPAGCLVEGPAARCSGAKIERRADNDTGTPFPDRDPVPGVDDLPVNAGAGIVSAGGDRLGLHFGTGTADSLATGRSCWSCWASGPDDDDRLPYQRSSATGPESASVPFRAGSVVGALLASANGCVTNCATATVDRDDVSGSARLAAAAEANHAAVDLVTLSGAPAGYSGMVRLGPAGVQARAGSGPGAPGPSVSGAPLTLELYDGGAYRNVSITPGAAAFTTTAHAEFPIGAAAVVMDATVTAEPAVVSTETDATGILTAARATLERWLRVEVRLRITEGGTTVADLVTGLDLGTVSAGATYKAT